jgi:hypothetical protein
MLKFDASIFGGELPIGLGVVGIAVVLPGGDFPRSGFVCRECGDRCTGTLGRRVRTRPDRASCRVLECSAIRSARPQAYPRSRDRGNMRALQARVGFTVVSADASCGKPIGPTLPPKQAPPSDATIATYHWHLRAWSRGSSTDVTETLVLRP